jgi:hypothetical protein
LDFQRYRWVEGGGGIEPRSVYPPLDPSLISFSSPKPERKNDQSHQRYIGGVW